DVMAGLTANPQEVEAWLRIGWLGLCVLPASYLHLSDTLLEATGRRSRGRRRLAVRLGYGFSMVFVLLVGIGDTLVDELTIADEGAIFLSTGPGIWVFAAFLAVTLGLTGLNLWRAYRRCLTSASRRRMGYLMAGSIPPMLGALPLVSFGLLPMLQQPVIFWSLNAALNVAVAVSMVLIAYVVAYFGVSVPDRVVKSRLFQWILRGPVVASSVLAVTVTVNRAAVFFGLENSRVVPFAMVSTLLILQWIITLVRPSLERTLFYGEDRRDIERLQILEQRLLTSGDLQQFLESVLNAACDVSGASSSFVAVIGQQGLELEVSVGPDDPLHGEEDLPAMMVSENRRQVEPLGSVFVWGRYWLIPLNAHETAELIGLMGLCTPEAPESMAEEQAELLRMLADRAVVALTDRLLQREVFQAVDRLVVQVDQIQRLRAAARYNGVQVFGEEPDLGSGQADLAALVRDALSHYWGGPRLTSSPLLRLIVVREAIDDQGGNPVNGLREILRRGIERVRPEGERRFTAEWMLYNILEMKFLEGRKVRDIAMRLAMSEADLYRKQRVAIEAVARAINDMEREALQSNGRRPAPR
ncbi:MAG: hypothetical protein MUO23_05120, partial [Anaerolineales bacterium]|nr:hypothetical protein [Anaerolineales bacterium]